MDSPQRGLFVRHRLEAISQTVHVRGLCPQPWFPLLRSATRDASTQDAKFPTSFVRMPYIPAICKWMDARWMQGTITKWLSQRSAKSDCNIILDAHFGYPEGVACWRVARSLHLPCFVTLRGVEEEWIKQPIVKRQLAKCLQSVNGVIAVSHSLANLARELGTSRDHIRVIPNGIDHSVFFPKPSSERQNKTTRIVCVGNLRHVKGHDIILRAFNILSARNFDFELSLVGGETEAAYSRKIDQMIQDLNLSKRVQRLGSLGQHQIAVLLRHSDLFVLASRREGCCNAILEALASGTPVVATDVGDNSKYVNQGNGTLVPNDDDVAFADAVEHVAGHRFAPNAIAQSVAGLTWEKTAHDVMEFMEEKLPA